MSSFATNDVKFLCTGTTGYIGGDFLFRLFEKYPSANVTCIVRNSDKGAKIATVYPTVRLVYGDLDAVDMIEEEASRADIVYHFANCDHEASAQAISKGMSRRTNEKPGYWIHTSGGMILATETIINNEYGNLLPKVFNDFEDVKELISLPDKAAHRNVDKVVLATASDKVKTAIVCPPEIYGIGRGPDNQRSILLPTAVKVMLETKKGFKVGKGQNIWNQIHIHDLSDLYLLLGESAIAGGPPATWNDQGYYLAENGDFVWGEALQSIADIASKKGLISSSEIVTYNSTEADQLSSNLSKAVGTNCRGTAIRGKKLLGWAPYRRPLIDELESAIDVEARRLGLIQGHAATVET